MICKLNMWKVALVGLALANGVIAQGALAQSHNASAKPVSASKVTAPPATPKIVRGVYYSPANQQYDIARVEKYLNGLTTLTADFTQVAPDKRTSKGKFFLSRPGKLRWEYSPVPPVVIVARNGNVTYYDKQLEQVSHVTTNDPLANILTQKNIKLTQGDLDVVYIDKPKDKIVLSVVKKKTPKEGRVTFTLKDPSMELESIDVTDAAGNITSIHLSNLVLGNKIDDKLFSIQIQKDLLKDRPR